MATWQQRSQLKAWFSGIVGRQKKNPSIELLKNLHLELLKAREFGIENKKHLVETYRSVSEIVVWGDQNDSRVFDYFLEHNMLSFFLEALSQKLDSRVVVQLLQSLSIVFENITNEMAMYYLLSNNHVNSIIAQKYDFSNEEVLAYYISLLKTLSMRLNKHTIHLFYNEHLRDFPLLTESLKFFLHSESMVRIAVRNITLNIFRVADSRVEQFVCQKPGPSFLTHLMWYIGSVVIDAVQLVEEKSPGKTGQLGSLIDAHLDHWTYLNDVLQLDQPQLAELIIAHARTKLLAPLYLASFLQCWDGEILHQYNPAETWTPDETTDEPVPSIREPLQAGEEYVQTTDQHIQLTGEPVQSIEETVQVSGDHKQVSKDREEPVQASEESVQTTEEPVQSIEEPVQSIEEPVQVNEESVQTTEEPVQSIEEPVQVNKESIQTTEEPVQVSEEPVQVSGEHKQVSKDCEEPVQSIGEPVQVSEESVQSIEEPGQSTEEPVQVSEESVQTTEEAVQSTREPVQVSGEPVQVGEESVQTTEEAVQSTREPVQVSGEPVQMTEKQANSFDEDSQPSEKELPHISREHSVFFVTQILSVVDNPVLIGPFLKKFLQGPTADSSHQDGFSVLMDLLCCHDNEFFCQLSILFLVTMLTNKACYGVAMETLSKLQLSDLQNFTLKCLSAVCEEGSNMSSRTGLLCLELMKKMNIDPSAVKSCEVLIRGRMKQCLCLMAGDEFVCLYRAQHNKVKNLRSPSVGLCYNPEFLQGHVQDNLNECEKVLLLFFSVHSFLNTQDLLPPYGLQMGDGDIIELSGFDMFMTLLIAGGRETEQFVAVSQTQCFLVEPDRLPGQGKIKKVISLDELEYAPDPASSTTVFISQRGRRISFKLKFFDPFTFRAAIKCMGRNKGQSIRKQIEFIAKVLDTTPPDNVMENIDNLLESFEIIHTDVGGVFDETATSQELEMSVFNHDHHDQSGVRYNKEDGQVEMGLGDDDIDGIRQTNN